MKLCARVLEAFNAIASVWKILYGQIVKRCMRVCMYVCGVFRHHEPTITASIVPYIFRISSCYIHLILTTMFFFSFPSCLLNCRHYVECRVWASTVTSWRTLMSIGCRCSACTSAAALASWAEIYYTIGRRYTLLPPHRYTVTSFLLHVRLNQHALKMMRLFLFMFFFFWFAFYY